MVQTIIYLWKTIISCKKHSKISGNEKNENFTNNHRAKKKLNHIWKQGDEE